jgi:tetratricopeptide (TPR) repeat protein
MSSIEALKEQARSHEQKEEWRKALSLYLQAIEKLAEEDQPDIGLYNRVGDLYIRLGETDEAVSHYEEAVDLYVDTELPNNAIAVCKKIIRNVPERHRPYLRMGQIRAGQGFIVDARTNFLAYAERMQGAGEYDEAFRALTEFAALVPDDTDVRLLIADQMASHDRTEEAVEQLIAGYRIAQDARDPETTAAFEERLGELAPDLDLTTVLLPVGGGDDFAFESTALGGEDAVAYGEISLSGPGDEADEEEADGGGADDDTPVGMEGETVPAAEGEARGDILSEGIIPPTGPAAEAPPGEVPGPPVMDPEGVEADEVAPAIGYDPDDLDEDIGGDLPILSFGDEDEDEEQAPEPVEQGLEVASPFADGDAVDEFDEHASGADEPPRGEEEVHAEVPAYADATDDLVPGGPGDADAVEPDDDEDMGGELPLLSFDDAEDPVSDEEPEVVASDAGSGDVASDTEVPAWGWTGAPAEIAGDGDVEAPQEEVQDEAPADAVEAAAEEEAAADRHEASEPAAPALSPGEELDALREQLARAPDDVELHQRAVELAFRTGDDDRLARAYTDLGHALRRTGSEARARAVFQQALDVDPEMDDARSALLEGDAPSAPIREVASSEDYVDLGAMILGDEPEEKTTRFRVAYEAPSGDEDADFAKMLSQFKEKVAENVDVADVKAHHDLGTAYKEMGLLDEAVEEFQAALRASADHLPTYELLGQVFLDQGNADAALRVLKRAQTARWEVEDELIGIYYYTARAHEELGQRADAVEYYDRVFSLDINFADVTDRLRDLR